MKNELKIVGQVQDHTLQVRQTKDGRNYISGDLKIAVDDALTVVPVTFNFVTELTKAGKSNRTYKELYDIVINKKTIIGVGKENAPWVSLPCSLDTNDYINKDNEPVQYTYNRGSFINNPRAHEYENRFDTDVIITNVRQIEPDLEKGIDTPYIELSGVTFGYQDSLVPVRLSARDAGAINYFMSLGITSANPLFTRVWGYVNNLVVKKEKTVEAAFGEDLTVTSSFSRQEYLITGAAAEPYNLEAGNPLSKDNLAKLSEARTQYLAEVKARYEARKNEAAAPISASPVAANNVAPASTGTTPLPTSFKF